MLLWALAEPPGPDRAAAATVTAYQSWIAARYDDPLDLRPRVAARGGVVPQRGRPWAGGRAGRATGLAALRRIGPRRISVGWAQPIREYLPEVSTALLVPDTRQALAPAPYSCNRSLTIAGTLPDLLATGRCRRAKASSRSSARWRSTNGARRPCGSSPRLAHWRLQPYLAPPAAERDSRPH